MNNLTDKHKEFASFRQMIGLTQALIIDAGGMSGLTLSSIENGKLRTSAVVFHKIKHAFKRLGYEFEFSVFLKTYDIYVPPIDEATLNGHIKYVRKYKVHKTKEFKVSVEDKEEKDLPDLEDSALFCNQFEKPFDNEKYCELEYPERIE